LRNSDQDLVKQATEILENRLCIALGPIFGELLQSARTEEEERVILEFWKNLPKVNEEFLFIEAGKLSNRYKLFSKGMGLIDCYILAAVKTNNLKLWTLDKKLLDAYQTLK